MDRSILYSSDQVSTDSSPVDRGYYLIAAAMCCDTLTPLAPPTALHPLHEWTVPLTRWLFFGKCPKEEQERHRSYYYAF